MGIVLSRKLGKLPPKFDARTLQLRRYLPPVELPAAPPSVDYAARVPAWGVMANDRVGDCTCAACGHMVMEWTANSRRGIVPSDAAVLRMYSAVTGYDPATGANDNGATCIDVLNYWRRHGLSRHKILAYAQAPPGDTMHVKQALYLFEGLYLGLAMPLSAKKQKIWAKPAGGWRGDGEPGSWGGHAVPAIAYDADCVSVITWGYVQKMSWAFFHRCVDESYACVSRDMLKAGRCPLGFDLPTLMRDLQEIV